MLKIKQKKWRRWGRLFLKAIFVACVLVVMFGVLFGLKRGEGENDGDLLLYCRICRDYRLGDVLLMDDGQVIEYDKANGGVVAGKVLAKLSVRRIVHEVYE